MVNCIKRFLVYQIIALAVVYVFVLVVSFVDWKFIGLNPKDWGEGLRLVSAMAVLFFNSYIYLGERIGDWILPPFED